MCRCLLESLMEYVFCHGADYNIEKTNQMLNLYNTHSALHNVMVASLQRQKNKKGEKGKKVEKKDATDEVSNEHIKSTQQYSPPLGCLSLKCLSLMLKAIFLDKTPSHRVSLEKLRENPKFGPWKGPMAEKTGKNALVLEKTDPRAIFDSSLSSKRTLKTSSSDMG